jgi:hypothetical protein
VWAFLVKMRDIFFEHMLEGTLAKEDHPREALLLDGAYPPLRVGVEIWRLWGPGAPASPQRRQ